MISAQKLSSILHSNLLSLSSLLRMACYSEYVVSIPEGRGANISLVLMMMMLGKVQVSLQDGSMKGLSFHMLG